MDRGAFVSCYWNVTLQIVINSTCFILQLEDFFKNVKGMGLSEAVRSRKVCACGKLESTMHVFKIDAAV